MGKYTVVLSSIAVVCILWFGIAQENSVYSTHDSEAQSQIQKLQQINHKMTENSIRTNRWHIYARNDRQETLPEEKMNGFVESQMDHLNMFDWHHAEQQDGTQVWKGVRTDQQSALTESMKLHALPVGKDEYRTYYTYEASMIPNSTDANPAFSLLINTEKMPEWLEQSEFFTRVEGALPENHETTLEKWGETIAKVFSAKIVEELQEASFVSTSAYTPLWDSQLETNGEPMNLQIALRMNENGLGGETTVTIGTPIITTEY
ncbi:YwmB family TATA-box binding protein [Alteribacter populi]|uniref:YwmB family TATA-box binding protein n=1 Tax=Alteribacter populi TaxID=2011011 RepID=UPI0012FDF3C9|nr:YwmB family TATA-box binding protein [Alteribacter populi]